MQQVKNNIGYIILAIAAIVIVVVAWFKATPASAPTVDQPATSTVQRETELPDFAYIEERNGERVLVNERDGYELVLEENWSVYEDDFTGGISVQDFVEPEPGYGGLPGCKVNISKKENTVVENIQSEREYCGNNDCTVEVTNNDEWTVLQVFGGFVGSGNPTYLKENNKELLSVSFLCSTKEFVGSITANINL